MLHTKLAPLLKNDPELKANITFLEPINNFPLKPLLKVSQLRKEDVNLRNQNLIQRHNVGVLYYGGLCLHSLLQKLIVTVKFSKKYIYERHGRKMLSTF